MHSKSTNQQLQPNHLIHEKSPYLLQHAYNLIDWYPWSDEAFERAKEEEKPIFLSIGYSSCHWCHVMLRESFEDKEVAKILNEHFISIKVDKEERPEVDAIYMTVCQMVTGHGGWPLTILMTPEQKPFYACTYLPKKSTDNMIGLTNLLNATVRIWNSDKDKLVRSGEELTDILTKEYQTEYSEEGLDKQLIADAINDFIDRFDNQYGGFGGAPKFPTPHNLLFLMRYAALYDDEEVELMVDKTLESMYRGGIFDHIGGGFSRYSTDKKWLIPHFEKMLYDNALLVIVYLEGYQFNRNPIYLEVAEKTLRYVMREMTRKDGGFYSSQDADSEGEEGKFYTFTPDEIIKVLGKKEGNAFNEYFNISEEGNFEGKNIPNLIHTRNIRLQDEQVNTWCDKVYRYRLERMALDKDDKVLTSWNALMIAAFARAYKVLHKKEYLEHAVRAYDFIQNKLRTKEGRLLIRYRKGESLGLGNIDDYSFLLFAQLELYEATFDIRYLKDSMKTVEDMVKLFWDAEYGGFFFYGNDAKQLIARPKETYDGAMPSGNSVAVYGMIKLERMLDDPKLREIIHKQTNFMSSIVKDMPIAYSFALCAFMLELYPMKELVCVAWSEEELEDLHKEIGKKYNPNLVMLLKTMANEDELERLAKYTKDYKMIGGQSTFYVCEGRRCQAPITGISHIHSVL